MIIKLKRKSDVNSQTCTCNLRKLSLFLFCYICIICMLKMIRFNNISVHLMLDFFPGKKPFLSNHVRSCWTLHDISLVSGFLVLKSGRCTAKWQSMRVYSRWVFLKNVLPLVSITCVHSVFLCLSYMYLSMIFFMIWTLLC